MQKASLPKNIYIPAFKGVFFIPEVHFKFDEGLFSIKGESYIEDTFKFYDPIIQNLEEFITLVQSDFGTLTFNFRLTYFNTTSNRALLKLLGTIKKAIDKDLNVEVNWHYPVNTPALLADGEKFMADSGILINLIGYQISDKNKPEFHKKLRTPEDVVHEIQKTSQQKNKKLYLGDAPHFSKFPQEVLALDFLESLSVGGRRKTRSNIDAIPPEIGQLSELITLGLKNNQLTSLPKELKELKNLKKLYLSRNNLDQIPKVLLEIKSLKNLHLTGNQIKALPEDLSNFAELETLYLGSNQIEKLPQSIGQLKNLKELFLGNNPLTEIPAEIGQLTQLQRLHIHGCQLTHLPPEITQLKNLKTLFIKQNPLKHPPMEIANQGIEAIRNYFEEIAQGTVKSYEAKLITVGNGRTGKTSVTRRLITDAFNPQEPSTHGIRIDQLTMPLHTAENQAQVYITLNSWDFGGQEIYHATHRFFLSTRALYLLIWDKRSSEDAQKNPEKEDNFNFTYWLDYIQTLSQNSPVLMVQNKIDVEKAFLENPNELRATYNIRDFVDVSASTNENIEKLKQSIQKQFTQSRQLKDIIGIELPKSWVKVKEQLEGLAQEKNYINYKQYLSICKAEGLDKKSANNLSHNFLHQVGTILHFPQPKQLKDMLILNPHWVTEAVYELLRAQETMQKRGFFTEDDIEEIWEAYELGEQVGFIELMKKFELLFEMPHKPQHYIAPQLLPLNPPENLPALSSNHATLVYRYKFLHKGVIGRIITKLNKYAALGCYWKHGILLEQENTKALVKVMPQHKQLWVKIDAGPKKEFLKEVIQQGLQEINTDIEVEICIPYTSTQAQTTHFFTLESLELRIEKGIEEVECPLSFEKVSIAYLLGEESDNQPTTATPIQKIKHWITLGQLDRALERALEISQVNGEIHNKLLLLQATYANLHDQEMLGLLTVAEIAQQKTKITQALLSFLDKL